MGSFIDTLQHNALEEGIFRMAVGAVILIDGKLLLLQRIKGDFMGGIVEFPSGIKEADESIEESLVREVKEEANLTVLTIKKYIGSFDYESKSKKITRQFNFLVEVTDNEEIVLSAKEHDKYFLIDINDIENEEKKYGIVIDNAIKNSLIVL